LAVPSKPVLYAPSIAVLMLFERRNTVTRQTRPLGRWLRIVGQTAIIVRPDWFLESPKHSDVNTRKKGSTG
jgi:hypothetical protein